MPISHILRTIACGTALTVGALSTSILAADLPMEKQQVGDKALVVTNKSELTLNARSDRDVRHRELWYRRMDGQSWGAWQKHSLAFNRETPITWSPVEGHWQAYIRIEEISGKAMPEPGPKTNTPIEVIVDRTGPTAVITGPAVGSKLRGGQPYTINWTVADPYLHSTPISLSWSRSGGSEKVEIASALANTGKFEWTTPLDMTDGGSIYLTASDKAANQTTTHIGNIVIDAVAPSRNIIGPAISASQTVPVAIRTTDAGPAGLAQVQLFYSQDGGTVWNPGPTIKAEPFNQINWQAPADGNYQLALVATDQSGNSNPTPKGAAGKQFDCLIDTVAPVVSLASPIAVVDPSLAPNAPIRRVFAGGDQVEVRFNVVDANPRADGVSILFQSQEGANWESLAQGLPPGQGFSFTIPTDINTSSARIKVVCTDVAGNSGEIAGGETFSIDNEVEAGEVGIEW